VDLNALVATGATAIGATASLVAAATAIGQIAAPSRSRRRAEHFRAIAACEPDVIRRADLVRLASEAESQYLAHVATPVRWIWAPVLLGIVVAVFAWGVTPTVSEWKDPVIATFGYAFLVLMAWVQAFLMYTSLRLATGIVITRQKIRSRYLAGVPTGADSQLGVFALLAVSETIIGRHFMAVVAAVVVGGAIGVGAFAAEPTEVSFTSWPGYLIHFMILTLGFVTLKFSRMLRAAHPLEFRPCSATEMTEPAVSGS
jgi:hypothetical protein